MRIASASFPALGTTASVSVTDPGALRRAVDVLEQELREVDASCSRFREDSELMQLNAAAGAPVVVGTRLLEAVAAALRAATVSAGLVDPTIGRTLRFAGYDRTFELVRAREASSFHATFTSVPGWRRIEIDPARSAVRVPTGVELDLGATAKALAADGAARAVAEATGCGVLVGLGGDVSVAGEPPPDGWPILIADDHAAALDTPGPTVAILSGGIASSSTTVRRWRAGDVELHHIIDPRTGRPAETPWRTVSVAASTCLDANVASTAAVVLGDDAQNWLAERALPARLVHVSGTIAYVGSWPEDAA